MNTENTPAPLAQGQSIPQSTTSLESQFSTAYAAIESAADSESIRLTYSLQNDGPDQTRKGGWCVSIGRDAFGSGTDLMAAVEEAIRQHGTAESRRAARLDKLRKEAAELGIELKEHAA